MRIGFNGREGLVIQQVSYNDNGTLRALFYQMSVAEMFVPCGDPRTPYQQKLPVDVGQFSLGYTVINLQATKLCACGGGVAYLDVSLSATWGSAHTARKVVCVYEEDSGILWGHQKCSMKVVSTRNTRLTITSMSNLGNYVYKFIWHFYMDGIIEFKGQLHGIVSTNLVAQNVTNTGGFGTVVSPSVNAQYHQHFFGLRLNAEIDGNLNNVAMKDIVPLSDPTGSRKEVGVFGSTHITRTGEDFPIMPAETMNYRIFHQTSQLLLEKPSA